METNVQNVIVGSLLGDGWLDSLSPNTKTTRFRVKYSDRSFGYLNWLREQVRELEPCEPKPIKRYPQHTFYTRANSELGKLRMKFYPNEGEKRVPKDIADLLKDPISLAIWYQDDGTLDKRKGYHWNSRIATYCFTYEDCTLLKEAVLKNFGIEVSVCRNKMRNKVYFELYVLSKSMERFIETVKPFIHNDFKYKIRR